MLGPSSQALHLSLWQPAGARCALKVFPGWWHPAGSCLFALLSLCNIPPIKPCDETVLLRQGSFIKPLKAEQ